MQEGDEVPVVQLMPEESRYPFAEEFHRTLGSDTAGVNRPAATIYGSARRR